MTWRWTTARATKITMISALARGKDTSYRSLSGANVWRLTVTHCTTSPSTRYKKTGIQQPSNIHYLTYGLNLTRTFAKRCRKPKPELDTHLILISHIFGAQLFYRMMSWCGIEFKCFHIYTVFKIIWLRNTVKTHFCMFLFLMNNYKKDCNLKYKYFNAFCRKQNVSTL